jgi:hypothetical protein
MWLAVSGVGLQLFVVLILPQFTKKAAHDEAEYDMTIGKEDEVKAGKEHAKEHKSEGAAPLADQTNATDEADAELASRPVVDATGEQNDTHPDLNNVEYEEGKGFMKIPFWTLQAASIVMIYAGVGGVIVGIATFPSQHTKISAAVLCTVCMSCLYFFSTFFLWAARAASDNEDSALTNAALAMSSVVRKAPMFAVMFLASRMRALQLDPPLGMPPFWMQCLFYTITSMIYVESIIAAIVGAVGTHRKSYYGIYVFKSEGKTLGCTQHMLGIISYFILIPIFYGVYSMKFADGSEAPLSTTLKCTIILEIAYFGVMLWQSLVLLVEQATAADWEINRNASAAAGISLGLSPLLCILFVATRMRALQITQQKGAPPGWAQDCMNIAVFACCVQAICCLLMPIFVGSACKVDDDGNPDYDLEPMVGAYAVAVLKYVMLFALHGSVITVCASVYLMTPETAHSGDRFIGSTKSLFKMMAITLVVFCISLLFSSAKVVGMAIKFAIEAADQAFLGVDIEVKKVALNAFKGYVHIKDLVVCQPKDEMIYTRDEKGKLTGEKTGNECQWDRDYIVKVGLVLLKINLWRIITTLGKEFELQNLSVKGIHANVEKPTCDIKKTDSNIEYIINFLDALGLIPPPEDPKEAKKRAAEEAAKAKAEAEAKKKAAEEAKKAGKKEEPKKESPPVDIPRIILHKIEFGDIRARVSVKKVPVVGHLNFEPTIGLITFDDIQRDIFGGREDLTGGETVACIIKAVASKICQQVMVTIPSKLKQIAKEKAAAGIKQVTGACGACSKRKGSEESK